MFKKKNIKLNAVLSALHSCFSILFSLVTYPYAVRVLGVENIGKISYSASIISYFSLIAMLGIRTYAIREGAKLKDNPIEFKKFTAQMFSINMLSTLVAYVVLAIVLLCISSLQNYLWLILIQSATMLLTTLSVDWINNIYEDFLHITLRSFIAYVAGIVFLFVFVKKPEDYVLYAFLNVIINLVICVSNLIYIRKYVKLAFTRMLDLKRHLKPILIFWANAVAITIYVSVDTTMIGAIRGAMFGIEQGDTEVGLYSVAVKVYTIVKTILSAVYAVAIPRLVSYFNEEDKSKGKNLFTRLSSSIILLLFPVVVGLMCLSEEIIYLISGEALTQSVVSLQILGVAIIFAILGGLVTACLNVAIGREKDNLISSVIAAGINFLLNFLFIPWLGIYGAAITTILAEFVVFLYCYIRIPNKKQYMDGKEIGVSMLRAVVGCIPILLITFLVKHFFANVWLRIALIMFGSIVIYALILLAFRDKNFLGLFGFMKRKKVVDTASQEEGVQIEDAKKEESTSNEDK